MTGPDRTMQGEVCLVTGATSGIGRAAAGMIAERGAHVILVGRDRQRGESAVAEIQQRLGKEAAEFLEADLSSQAEVRRLAQDVLARYPRLDALVNNAGAIFGTRQLSVDGIEMTFALNHLGYFLLTSLLLPALRTAEAPRIVNVASDAHRGVQIDFNDLQNRLAYHGFTAYGKSKLANIYFTYELARRLEGSAIQCNVMHPGFVATSIGESAGLSQPAWREMMDKNKAISAEEGAETAVYLASDPEVRSVTGRYFVNCQPTESSLFSYDFDVAKRLWDVSAQLTGVPK